MTVPIKGTLIAQRREGLEDVMKYLLIFNYLALLCFISPAWSAEMWCLQSPVYPTEGEAKRFVQKLSDKKVRIEKVKTGYVAVWGEFSSEEEARTRWEKDLSILPGSVIRRCDGNPSPELKTSDNNLFLIALEKKRAGDVRSALEHLKKALDLEKGKGGAEARILYEMAHCYDILNEKDQAREIYRQAIGLNPSLGVAPPEIIYEEGFKAYKRKEFSRALRIFSQYNALYPRFRPQAYYFMACSLMEMKQYRRAMYFFDRLIKEHAGTSYAMESILALGNIGLVRPKVKVPLHLASFDYAWSPISAYNEVLKKDLPPERRDQVFLSKAYGYLTMGRPDLAHQVLVECVRKFASGPYRAQARLVLARNLPAAVKIYEERKDDLGVISVFFQTSALNLPFPTNMDVVRAVAKAFRHLGFNEELHHFLKAARVKVASKDVAEVDRMIADANKPDEKKKELTCEDYYQEYEQVKAKGAVPASSLTLAVAECRFRLGDYRGSIPYYDYVVKYTAEGQEKIWAHLRLGQAHFRAGKKDEAEKIFSALKGVIKEEFWMRVVELTEETEKWRENYRQISLGTSPGTTSPSP